MGDQGYRSPRIRNVLLGIAAFVVLLVLICSMSQALKWTGAALMYVPNRLGLVRSVNRSQVMNFDLSASPMTFEFSEPGRYAVYAADYDLLTLTMMLEYSGAQPWLVVNQQGTGEPIPVAFVARGLRLYDTPLAAGRPIFTFELPQAGRYVLVYPQRNVPVSLVPDYTTGREGVIFLVLALEVLLVLLPFAVVFYRRERARRSRLEALYRPSKDRYDRVRKAARPPGGDQAGGEG